MSKPVKYSSPTKGSSAKPNSPHVPSINTSRDVSRRVWIRRGDGSAATSLYVKEYHLVDDLKTMIVQKFPMTLEKTCDPSDLIIKLEPALSSLSPSLYTSPSTPGGGRKHLASFSATSTPMPLPSPNFSSPLSPIPVSASKSSLIPPRPPSQDFASLSLSTASPATLPLEADKPVWAVLDQYYPQGMGMDNAFVVDVPSPMYSSQPNLSNLSSSLPQSSTFTHKKNVSQETITEDKEHDYRNPPPSSRRINSLPHSGITGNGRDTRSTTPSGHKRSQSNPPEHSSAVLLMPSSKPEGKTKGRTQNIVSHSDTPERVLSPNTVDERGRERQDTASPHTRLNGTSTMAKVLPSVNVLIVEDNLINLRILSAHLRRHRIHYDVAKNGQEAIDKWRKGGFHLVLMDIQLPVMSGLEASKTIRRLEKLNHIGVFSQSDLQNLPPRKPEEELDLNIFRSPVIIVALTASNLKQDKQQALAAGCNDYLTKPVNLDWLLNKITEWGCMQALIDFDGWKSGERMTNISAALPSLTRKSSSRRVLSGGSSYK